MNRVYALMFLVLAVSATSAVDEDLLGAAHGQMIEPGHTAMWFAPERSGEGWVLEVLDSERALLYWFTYDEQGGQRWLTSIGEIQGGRIVFPELLMPHGGRFGEDFDPDEVMRDVVGEAMMTFDDCDRGSFEYEAFGQSQTIAFQRLSRTDGLACDGVASEATDLRAGFTGSWYDPSHSGEGYVVQWMANGEAMVVWFTYDSQGNSYWILAVGHPEGDELVFADMRATRGARFGHEFDAGDVERFAWGELRLSLGCDTGTATYASIFPEFGSGQLDLVPLTRPEGVICESSSGGWSGQGPFGGDVELLEISPHDPDRIYAAPRWGLFRSDNEGRNWRNLSEGVDSRTIQTLAAAPDDADTVYAATSDELLKSVNGGHSWARLEPDPAITVSGRLTIDIHSSDSMDITVAAPDRGGIYRSRDGGASWIRLDEELFDGVDAFAYWPDNREIIVAAGTHSEWGAKLIFRSINGGADWDWLDTIYTPRTGFKFLPLEDGRVLYAGRNAVFESVDAGETWREVFVDCPLLNDSDFIPLIFEADSGDADLWYLGGSNGLIRFSNSGQACTVISGGMTIASLPDMEARVSSFRVRPGDSNVLYAGTMHAGIFRSDDGGNSWEQRNQGFSRTIIRALATHPASSEIIYAGYGDAYSPADGLWTSVDGGATWSATAEGLGITGVRGIAIDPNTVADPEETHLYAVGWGWQYSGVSGGLKEGSAGVFKSVDGGASWFDSGHGIPVRDFENISGWGDNNRPVMRSIVLDPPGGGGPSQTLYVAGNGLISFDASIGECTTHAHRIYKSTDAGNSWVAADEGLPRTCDRSVQVVPMVIDPVDPQTLYVGTFLTLPGRFSPPMESPVYENGVFKSTDGGVSWNLSSRGLPRFDDNDPETSHWDVIALAAAPSAPNVLYAAVRRSIHIVEDSNVLPQPSMIYKTTDGGATWSPANGGIPDGAVIRGFVIDPDDAETVYAANSRASASSAVFRTTDGGTSWAPFSDGLNASSALMLAIDTRDSGAALHAGTDGGVFSAPRKQ